MCFFFFFSSRRRHTRWTGDWSSDVCSSDLTPRPADSRRPPWRRGGQVAGRAGGSVFLLTDYGLADEFAGVVRASVLRHAPGVPIIDLTHGVTPFDVRAGALALVRAVPHLGPGVVMAVVDPGVGTS